MHQESLFHESWEIALQDTVIKLGGYKKVAALMWPSMKQDSAYSKLKACLNEEKEREKFTLSEIQRLTKLGSEAGFHYSAIHFNSSTGYENPVPMNPEKVKAELEKKVVAAAGGVMTRATQQETQPKDYPVFPEVAIESDKNVFVLVQRGPHLTHHITLDAEAEEKVFLALLERRK